MDWQCLRQPDLPQQRLVGRHCAVGALGLSAQVVDGNVVFSWNPAGDLQTPAGGLSYNLRVGTTSLADDVVCCMADLGTGYRRIPAAGNAQQRLSWPVKGPCGTLYWSVQAVDTAFAGSPWPEAQHISIPHAPCDLDQDCDVDLGDFILFEVCALGPEIPHDGTPICQMADGDGDGDVDLTVRCRSPFPALAYAASAGSGHWSA